jgi:hypothetical protein
MVDTLANLVFKELDARVDLILSTRRGLAKDWERPTKREIMAIIMQSDKATLKKHKMASKVKN